MDHVFGQWVVSSQCLQCIISVAPLFFYKHLQSCISPQILLYLHPTNLEMQHFVSIHNTRYFYQLLLLILISIVLKCSNIFQVCFLVIVMLLIFKVSLLLSVKTLWRQIIWCLQLTLRLCVRSVFVIVPWIRKIKNNLHSFEQFRVYIYISVYVYMSIYMYINIFILPFCSILISLYQHSLAQCLPDKSFLSLH